MTEQTSPSAVKRPWYVNSKEGLKNERVRQETGSGPQRFRVDQAPASRDILMVDDNTEITFHEHEYRKGRDFGKIVTCVQGVHDDVVCCEELGDKSRSYVTPFTILTMSAYKGKKGTYQYELMEAVCKYGTANLIAAEREDNAKLGIAGGVYRVRRMGEKSPKTGDNWKRIGTFKEEHWRKYFELATYRGKKLKLLLDMARKDPEKREVLGRIFNLDAITHNGVIADQIPPFNYAVVHEPKSPSDLKLLLRGATVDTFGDKDKEKGGKGGDDDFGADDFNGGGDDGDPGPGASSGPHDNDDIPFD